MQQAHNLRNPRPRDVAEAGDVSLVEDDATANKAVEANRECHHAGDARHAARFDG